MIRVQAFRLAPPRPPRTFAGAIGWLFGLLAAGLALIFGAIFAVVTAVAVALFALVAGALVFAARLFSGRRPRPAAASGPADEAVIEAHKVGDQWVAYGWDRQAR